MAADPLSGKRMKRLLKAMSAISNDPGGSGRETRAVPLHISSSGLHFVSALAPTSQYTPALPHALHKELRGLSANVPGRQLVQVSVEDPVTLLNFP